jgi:hypothetical protein
MNTAFTEMYGLGHHLNATYYNCKAKYAEENVPSPPHSRADTPLGTGFACKRHRYGRG